MRLVNGLEISDAENPGHQILSHHSTCFAHCITSNPMQKIGQQWLVCIND